MAERMHCRLDAWLSAKPMHTHYFTLSYTLAISSSSLCYRADETAGRQVFLVFVCRRIEITRAPSLTTGDVDPPAEPLPFCNSYTGRRSTHRSFAARMPTLLQKDDFYV